MSTTSYFDVQYLVASDIGLLRALLTVFGDAFGEKETYTGSPSSDGYLRDLLGGEDFIALVAIRGDDVVGGLTAYVLRKFEQERNEVYIYDLAVASQHRRRGIATGLIEQLKFIAKARRAHVIYVQADPGDEPAIALYAKIGVREDVLHFDIAVEEPRPRR
jgi:aminoglycoside 3-N-acetyltransferase I